MTRFEFRGPFISFMCCVTQMGGQGREKKRKEGEAENDKEVFHLKNECMLQTQEGPQRTTE